MNDTNEMDTGALRERVIAAIRTVKDPEIPVNLYDLGLIYELDINERGEVHVTMTLTTPNCPVADALPASVKEAVRQVRGVSKATVELTWDPAWTPERLSEDGRAAMDMMGIDAANPSAGAKFTGLSVGRTAGSRRPGRR